MIIKKKFKSKKNIISKSANVYHGFYAVQSIDCNNINLKQIESFKKIIKKKIKGLIFLYPKFVMDYPVTKKVKNSRMGKGKGNINDYIFKIKRGQILYEMDVIKSSSNLEEVFSVASKQLPVKIRIIKNTGL